MEYSCFLQFVGNDFTQDHRMSPLCMDDVTDRYFVVCGATSRPCTASEGGVRPFLSTASGTVLNSLF